MDKKQIKQIIVGLSKPSKMPCHGYSIPAKECKTGGKLRDVPGSVCSSCYACKGNYRFSNVEKALYKRLDAIHNPQWVEAMAYAIVNSKFFRWHDSGDIQNLEHLKKICEVCRLTPDTKHWLPTKEKKIIKEYILKIGNLPKNLTVRLSAYMVDSAPPKYAETIINDQVRFSTVHSETVKYGRLCPAPTQGNKCLDCRACWDKRIKIISYKKH